MKKLLLGSLLLAPVFGLHAQTLNGGFEAVASSGRPYHWSKTAILNVSFDSLGNPVQDSMVLDGLLYWTTLSAHSGSRAIEFRNWYNATTGAGIAGGANMRRDTNYDGMSAPDLIPVTSPPDRLSFWYKLSLAGNDIAYAKLTVYDAGSQPIGEAAAFLSSGASVYTYFSTPVVYTVQGTPAFISISFSNAAPGSSITLGTRFVVDDVNTAGLGVAVASSATRIASYPNPATEELHLRLPESAAGKSCQWEVLDMAGRIAARGTALPKDGALALPVRQLSSGTYQLRLSGSFGMFSSQFSRR